MLNILNYWNMSFDRFRVNFYVSALEYKTKSSKCQWEPCFKIPFQFSFVSNDFIDLMYTKCVALKYPEKVMEIYLVAAILRYGV